MVKRLALSSVLLTSACSLVIGDEPRRLVEDAGMASERDAEPASDGSAVDAGHEAASCSASPVCLGDARQCYGKCDAEDRKCRSECDDDQRKCDRCPGELAKCEANCRKNCVDCTTSEGCPAACTR
jgi:hypothetical protein